MHPSAFVCISFIFIPFNLYPPSVSTYSQWLTKPPVNTCASYLFCIKYQYSFFRQIWGFFLTWWIYLFVSHFSLSLILLLLTIQYCYWHLYYRFWAMLAMKCQCPLGQLTGIFRRTKFVQGHETVYVRGICMRSIVRLCFMWHHAVHHVTWQLKWADQNMGMRTPETE